MKVGFQVSSFYPSVVANFSPTGYRHTFESLSTFSPDDDMHGAEDVGNAGTEWEDTELGDIEASELTDLEISDDELAG